MLKLCYIMVGMIVLIYSSYKTWYVNISKLMIDGIYSFYNITSGICTLLLESGQEYIPNLHYVGLMYQTVVHGNLFEWNIFPLCVRWQTIVSLVGRRRVWMYMWMWKEWVEDTACNDFVTTK